MSRLFFGILLCLNSCVFLGFAHSVHDLKTILNEVHSIRDHGEQYGPAVGGHAVVLPHPIGKAGHSGHHEHSHHEELEGYEPLPAPQAPTPKVKACPDGFIVDGEQCVANVFIKPTAVCTGGTAKILRENGTQCANYVPKISFCELGYLRVKGHCVKYSEVAEIASCEDGYELDADIGLCSRVVDITGKPYCETPAVLEGNICVETTEYPGEMQCPENFILEAGVCVTEVPAECPKQPINISPLPTSEGHVHRARADHNGGLNHRSSMVSDNAVGDHNLHNHIRSLNMSHSMKTAGLKKNYYVVPPNRPGNDLPLLATGVCEGPFVVSPSLACLEGGELHGCRCVQTIETSALVSAPGIKIETVEALMNCPEGSRAMNNGWCQITNEAPVQYECPEGAVEIETTCGLLKDPVYVCPNGFTRVRDRCTKKIFTPVVVVPEDSLMNGCE